MPDAAHRSPAESGVDRRTILKGAAWSVPAIAFAVPVPAYAASPTPCTPSTVFDNLQPGSAPKSIVFQPSLVTASLTYTSSGQGGDSTPGDTGKVAATSTNPSWNYIELEMVSQLNAGDYVELTIALSEPVTGLSLVLHDIDQTAGGWRDTVQVMTTGFTYILGGNLQGAGTQANPFRPINNGDTPIDSGLGDVRITWPGTLSVVKIRYIAGITGNSSNQHIGLGDLSYEACLPSTGVTARSRSVARTLVPTSEGEPEFVPSDESFDS